MLFFEKTLQDLVALSQKASHRKLLGIDWGEKRIGVAVSDKTGLIASPLDTVLCQKTQKKFKKGLKNEKKVEKEGGPDFWMDQASEKLASLISRELPLAVILGLPINMDGSLGFQAQNVIRFSKKLEEKISIPVLFWDERLSSSAIERLMITADVTRCKREKTIDKSSAAFVLQGVLDCLNRALNP